MTVGLNILGDRGVDFNEVVNDVARLGADYNLVMNNAALAAEVHLRSRKKVIFRWWENDDNAQDRQDAREFVRFRHRIAPPGALLYLGNEPWATQKLANWTMEAMDECEILGRRGVILNFSTGNPEPSVLPVFKGVIDRAWRKGHILGLHEYFDRNWRNDFPWHVGRFMKIVEMMGSRMPEVVMTEVGEARRFHPLRGYRWNGDDEALTDENYGKQLVEMAKLYAPYNIHPLIFAKTKEDVGDDWQTFNPRPKVLEIVSAYNKMEKPVEAPKYPALPIATDSRWRWTSATANSQFVNVRSTPVAAGVANKVGEIRKGTPVKIIMDAAAGYNDGVGTWRPVTLPTGAIGWARDDVFTTDDLVWHDRVLRNAWGSNQRRMVNGAILSVIENGANVSVSFPGEPIRAGGYEWALVMRQGGLIGWVALTQDSWDKQFEGATKPVEPVKLIEVPYASQWGWASGRTAMCGAAAAWMVIANDRRERALKLPSEITVDTVANYVGLTKSSFATAPQLQQALEAYGVPSKHTLEMTIDGIKAEIDAGNPVLLLIDYGHISQRVDKAFTVGHFVVAVGYDHENIIINDSDYNGVAGKSVRYKTGDVAKALSDTRFSGNRPNQALLIRRYQKPQAQ